jgi:hypothetical protein
MATTVPFFKLDTFSMVKPCSLNSLLSAVFRQDFGKGVMDPPDAKSRG